MLDLADASSISAFLLFLKRSKKKEVPASLAVKRFEQISTGLDLTGQGPASDGQKSHAAMRLVRFGS